MIGVKNTIRKKILSMRNRQKKDVKLNKDAAIKKRLLSLPEVRKAKIVLCYVSIKGEVKTDDMIPECLEHGKRILVPFLDDKKEAIMISEIKDLDELSPGAFGIPQPKNPKEFSLEKIDLIVVPGIAFDRRGNRVGYGSGFYDRFLKKLKKGIPTVALAYDFQIVKEIPTNGMDVRVHKIVTEKEIIKC